MFPTINKRETGVNLRRLMDQRGLTVKDVQEHLGFATPQGVYHWISGRSLPTIDNLYALSELLQVPMDAIVRGTRSGATECVCSMNVACSRNWNQFQKHNMDQAA